jgi:DNA-binding CsgD family transcriptional regulator
MDTTTTHAPAHGLGEWPFVGRADLAHRVLTALASRRVDGVVLRGPMGVGKTRLATEVAAGLGGRDVTVHRVLAAGGGAFAAVAHLLPAGTDTADPLAVAAALAEVLGAGTGQAVVVVDDLPSLDPATAGALAAMVVGGRVGLLATARDGERLPDAFAGLAGSERIATVGVEPLDERSSATLLHLALGGPVDGAAAAALTGPAAGNPLFLRELVLAAVEDGALADSGGVWLLQGDLPRTTRLREVVESRLRTLSEGATAAIELLALCQPVALEELEAEAGLAAVEELEARGLLHVEVVGRRTTVSLDHPFHAEAVRLALPTLRARSILRRHLERIEAVEPADELGRRQRIRLRLDAGVAVEPAELLDAGQRAFADGDLEAAAALLGPVLEDDPSWGVALLAGQAAFELGDFAAADAALGAAMAQAPTPADRATIAVTRSQVLLWGSGSAEAAIALLEGTLADDDLGDEQRALLSSEVGSHLVFVGEPEAALERLDWERRWPQVADGGTPAFLTALALAGRPVEAAERARAAAASAPTDVLPGLVARETYDVSLAFALAEAGLLDEAHAVATAGHEQGAAERRTLAQYWFALLLGRTDLLRGHAADAQQWFVRARAIATDAGLGAPSRSALVGLTVATALLGEPGATAAAAAELAAAPPFAFIGPETGIAEGWARLVAGDLAGARAVLRAAADDAERTGHRTTAAWLWLDLARLGEPADAVPRLDALAEVVQGELVEVRRDHARALVARDAAGLQQAGDRFEALGARLLAAEALTGAADRHRAEGDQRAASAAAVRAADLLARCQGARTPAVAAATDAVVPLTDREREVALLAARGLQSRAIADQLFLSFRTVNNHLQRAYEKLGINGRAELAGALGLDQRAGSAA